jgi:ribosomal protein L11 methyltransferase
MDYLKLIINITPMQEWVRDVLASQLAETGFESFAETEQGLEAFIPADNFIEEDFNAVIAAFKKDIHFQVKKEVIKSQNWNEVWEKNYFKPLVIANECLVRAPFHKEYPNCRYEILIEPNMAFGTGNHETTSMMLEAILKEDMEGKQVLDMGCGTGILGILASMKGAARITAIDIDEWPVKGTVENAELNRITNLEVKKGDARLLGSESYDVILANIHKNVLMHDMHIYTSCLNKGGKLFMSGFYLEDLPDITSKANECGLKMLGHQEKNRWVVAAFQS